MSGKISFSIWVPVSRVLDARDSAVNQPSKTDLTLELETQQGTANNCAGVSVCVCTCQDIYTHTPGENVMRKNQEREVAGAMGEQAWDHSIFAGCPPPTGKQKPHEGRGFFLFTSACSPGAIASVWLVSVLSC